MCPSGLLASLPGAPVNKFNASWDSSVSQESLMGSFLPGNRNHIIIRIASFELASRELSIKLEA